jgi:HAD superfamily hydrolase (TIGR01509 family)
VGPCAVIIFITINIQNKFLKFNHEQCFPIPDLPNEFNKMKFLINKSAIIFDMDGTLVNNEPLKGEALAETCRRHGGESQQDVYKEVLGCRYEIVRSYFCKDADISVDDDIFDSTFKEVYLNLLNEEIKLTDGAREYLTILKNENLKLALVSSAQKWQIDSLLDKLSMDSDFDLIVSREDVNSHKPSPEAYIFALDKLGLQANDVLVFEDSYSGLNAARGAGCQVIAIRHNYNQKHDFSSALRAIESFREIM